MKLLAPFVGVPRNQILCGSAESLFPFIPSNSIDMGLTSPPYDNLRTYNGFSWDFPTIAREYYRVLKPGGVLVWVVGDGVTDDSETLTSFEQALHFKKVCGFKMHDTMVYRKNGSAYPSKGRYSQVFEYMFVLSKGVPTVTHLQMTKSNWGGHKRFGKQSARGKDGKLVRRELPPINEMKVMDNVWDIDNGYGYTTKDDLAYEHPAMFPEDLARRHIETWSNPGDIVLDCFMGSGTTAKMARQYNRDYIGFEISSDYVAIARRRLAQPFTPMFAELAG